MERDDKTRGSGTRAGRSRGDRRRPGSHDPEGNRRSVLDAARRLFGAHGYNGVGIRAIASEAGVTPGLVMSYFGSKDGLLREVIGDATGDTEDVLTSSTAEELPGALARAYLDRWDRLPDDDPWPALIRSAVTHQPSAALLSDILGRQVTAPLMRLLGADDSAANADDSLADAADADARAAVIRSILFGVIMERYLFAHEPAASVPTGEFATVLTDVLGAAFGERAGGAPRTGSGRTGSGRTGSANSGRFADSSPPAAPSASAPSPSSLLAALSRRAAHHRRSVDDAVRAYGISTAAYEVLGALREAGDPYRLTMGEIAAAGEVGGGVTALVNRLAEQGLVRRERDAQDRRIVRIRLTRKGLGVSERALAARAARERELLAGLGSADRRRLAALLASMEGTPEEEW